MEVDCLLASDEEGNVFIQGYETAFLAVRYESVYETAVWNQGMKPGYETHESREKAHVETKVWNQSMEPRYENRYETRKVFKFLFKRIKVYPYFQNWLTVVAEELSP
jgi:hypothetical protein